MEPKQRPGTEIITSAVVAQPPPPVKCSIAGRGSPLLEIFLSLFAAIFVLIREGFLRFHRTLMISGSRSPSMLIFSIFRELFPFNFEDQN